MTETLRAESLRLSDWAQMGFPPCGIQSLKAESAPGTGQLKQMAHTVLQKRPSKPQQKVGSLHNPQTEAFQNTHEKQLGRGYSATAEAGVQACESGTGSFLQAKGASTPRGRGRHSVPRRVPRPEIQRHAGSFCLQKEAQNAFV